MTGHAGALEDRRDIGVRHPRVAIGGARARDDAAGRLRARRRDGAAGEPGIERRGELVCGRARPADHGRDAVIDPALVDHAAIAGDQRDLGRARRIERSREPAARILVQRVRQPGIDAVAPYRVARGVIAGAHRDQLDAALLEGRGAARELLLVGQRDRALVAREEHQGRLRARQRAQRAAPSGRHVDQLDLGRVDRPRRLVARRRRGVIRRCA
jgi:hypothetical protein